MEINRKKYCKLERAKLSKKLLESQATTFSSHFAAIAEFIDNSRDAESKSLHISCLNTPEFKVKHGLCFLDDGIGMSPKQCLDAICYGKSRKKEGIIGQYGLGLKSASMKLANNMILFSKHKTINNENIFSILLLSRQLNTKEFNEECDEIVIPMPSFRTSDCKPFEKELSMPHEDAKEKFEDEMSLIHKYSPFKKVKDLKENFEKIKSDSGTLIFCYDLTYNTDTREDYLKIDTDKKDILVNNYTCHLDDSTKFDYESLRAYVELLYFNPIMKIYIFDKRVETKHFEHSLAHPARVEQPMTKIQDSQKNMIKTAEDAVEQAKQNLEKTKQEIHSNSQKRENVKIKADEKLKKRLKEAYESVEKKEEELEEKKKNAKKEYKTDIFYGFNIHNRFSDGIFVYHNERLITRHEKITVSNDKKFNGICAIINLRYDCLEVSQSKEYFTDDNKYKKLIKTISDQYLTYYEYLSQKINSLNKAIETFLELSGYSKENFFSGSTDLPANHCNYNGKDNFDCKDFRYKTLKYIQLQCKNCRKWREISYTKEILNNLDFDNWDCTKNTEIDIITPNTCKHDQVLNKSKIKLLISNSNKNTTSKKQALASTSSNTRQETVASTSGTQHSALVPLITSISIPQPNSLNIIQNPPFINSFKKPTSDAVQHTPKRFGEFYPSSKKKTISSAKSSTKILNSNKNSNREVIKVVTAARNSALVDSTLKRVNSENSNNRSTKRVKNAPNQTIEQNNEESDDEDKNRIIIKFTSMLDQMKSALDELKKTKDSQPGHYQKLTYQELTELNTDRIFDEFLEGILNEIKTEKSKERKRIIKEIRDKYKGSNLDEVIEIIKSLP